MRIDAHQHFWSHDQREHSWISEQMSVLRRDYHPAELVTLLQAEEFSGCVAVQASQSLKETRWLLSLAEEYGFIRGVVGWVDLRANDLDVQLEEFAGNTKLVGVRHVVQDEPDDRFLLREDFERGIAALAQHDLTYDLLLYPNQLKAATELAGRFPGQKFVLDHLGKPPIASGMLRPWQEDLQGLARHRNVFCKLSGMVTEARWGRWRQADFTPYLDAAFDAFGADRLMIGSDWPVSTLSADYATTMGIVRKYIADLPEAEQEAVLGENCRQFYGLLP